VKLATFTASPPLLPSLHLFRIPHGIQGVVMRLDGIVIGALQGEVEIPGPCEESPGARLAVAACCGFPFEFLDGLALTETFRVASGG
jgi:hypothetical protein